MSGKDGYTILSELAQQSGQQVGWDSATKNVSVGDSNYTPDQLKGMGGYIEAGKWHLPTEQANNIVNTSKAVQQSNGFVDSSMKTYDEGLAGQLESLNAVFKQDYENQLAELNLAFQEAINSGQISIREAEADYEKQKNAIMQRAYQDSEATALMGQQRGVQNSQQMMGMMASDNQRANSMMNENVVSRDTRIANLKDRLNSLAHEKNIRSNSLLGAYNANVSKVAGDAIFNRANKELELKGSEWNRIKGQEFATGERIAGQEHQKFLQDNAFANQIKAMAIENGYDVQMMKDKFAQELKLEGIQSANRITLANLNHANSKELLMLEGEEYLKKLDYQLQAEQKALLQKSATEYIDGIKNYNLQLDRELKSYTPGTKEYKLKEAQIQQTKQEFLDNAVANYLADIYVASEINGFDPNKLMEQKIEDHKFSGWGYALDARNEGLANGMSRKQADEYSWQEFLKYVKRNTSNKEIDMNKEAFDRLMKKYFGQ